MTLFVRNSSPRRRLMSVLRKVPARLQKLRRRRKLSKSDNSAMEQPSDSASSPSRSEESSTSREESPVSVDMSIPGHGLECHFDQSSSETHTRTSISEDSSESDGTHGSLDAEITDATAKVAYIFSKDAYALHARTIEAGKIAQQSRSRSSPATRRRW